RNWLLIVGSTVTVALVTLAIVHAVDPHFLFVCQAVPSKHTTCGPNGVSIAEIEVAGGVAGLITALIALIRLNVYSTLLALPLWQSLIRLPAGAAGALLGVLLVQSKLVT